MNQLGGKCFDRWKYRISSSVHQATHTSSYATPVGPSRSLFLASVDMISIAQSEIVIGTKCSSYSIIAAAFQGNVPYLVSKGGKCEQPTILEYNCY